MLPVFARRQGYAPFLLVALPAVSQVMGESTRDKCAHSESSGWWFSTSKDKDTLHFENYLHKADRTDDQTMMLWPSLQAGLKQRAADEILLQTRIQELQKRSSLDEKEKLVVSNTLSELLYGKGFTVEDRQVYLEKHGCVKATEEALKLVKSTSEKRGIVEIGVGFGQWARLLEDKYKLDIVVFDNMFSLPLDPRVHNTKTSGYAKYFYQGKVRFGDAQIFQNDQLKKLYQLDGRVLMIIFPDPGPMALECVQAYTRSHELNDTLIYVGEGRGGANGSAALFDELESVDDKGRAKWLLQETCKLSPFGDKGFERLFIFKKNALSK
jgi:hypothetical protein